MLSQINSIEAVIWLMLDLQADDLLALTACAIRVLGENHGMTESEVIKYLNDSKMIRDKMWDLTAEMK